MVKDDSWSDWCPDPGRAARAHDPTLEPYASMSLEGLVAALLDARGGQEWEFLLEFVLDKCGEDDRRLDRFLELLRARGGLAEAELCFLLEVAGLAARFGPPGGHPP